MTVANHSSPGNLPVIASHDKPHIVIEPPRGWTSLELGDLWRYRELLFFLTWRDIKLRYKQTVLGATRALLQPLFTMVVFSVIFGSLAGLPADGIPYPIFTFTALLPWQLFAFSLGTFSGSGCLGRPCATLTNFSSRLAGLAFGRPSRVALAGCYFSTLLSTQ